MIGTIGPLPVNAPNLLENALVRDYTAQLEYLSGLDFKVNESAPAGGGTFIVSSQALQKNGPPVGLEWRVHENNGAFRIVDVAMDGLSMGVTQRSEFSEIIQRGGGNVDALLCALRKQSGTSLAQRD